MGKRHSHKDRPTQHLNNAQGQQSIFTQVGLFLPPPDAFADDLLLLAATAKLSHFVACFPCIKSFAAVQLESAVHLKGLESLLICLKYLQLPHIGTAIASPDISP